MVGGKNLLDNSVEKWKIEAAQNVTSTVNMAEYNRKEKLEMDERTNEWMNEKLRMHTQCIKHLKYLQILCNLFYASFECGRTEAMMLVAVAAKITNSITISHSILHR